MAIASILTEKTWGKIHYNCIRPHNTLSKNRNKSYIPRTPALVAKLIDKNWTIETAFRTPMIL